MLDVSILAHALLALDGLHRGEVPRAARAEIKVKLQPI